MSALLYATILILALNIAGAEEFWVSKQNPTQGNKVEFTCVTKLNAKFGFLKIQQNNKVRYYYHEHVLPPNLTTSDYQTFTLTLTVSTNDTGHWFCSYLNPSEHLYLNVTVQQTSATMVTTTTFTTTVQMYLVEKEQICLAFVGVILEITTFLGLVYVLTRKGKIKFRDNPFQNCCCFTLIALIPVLGQIIGYSVVSLHTRCLVFELVSLFASVIFHCLVFFIFFKARNPAAGEENQPDDHGAVL